MSLTLTQVNSLASNNTLSGVAIARTSNVMYACYSNNISRGVEISVDGGFTWNSMGGPGFNQNYTGIACNDDGSVLYVCNPGNTPANGVYKYDSNGSTPIWTLVIPSGTSVNTDDVSLALSIAFASSFNGTDSIILNTSNFLYVIPINTLNGSPIDTTNLAQANPFSTSGASLTGITSIVANSTHSFIVFNNQVYSFDTNFNMVNLGPYGAFDNSGLLSNIPNSLALDSTNLYIVSTTGTLAYNGVSNANYTETFTIISSSSIGGNLIAFNPSNSNLLVGAGSSFNSANYHISTYLITSGSPLVLVYNITTPSLTLPLSGGTITNVNWGDGNQDTSTSHTYATGAKHNPIKTIWVLATGVTTFSYSDLQIIRCISFGEIGLTNLNYAFNNCSNLIQVPTSLPTTSFITNMSYMFQNASSFNSPINTWDVSHVTNMTGMFYNATPFNQPIGSWNVSNVQYMDYMFGTTYFNQPIGAWNVSNVTSMTYMFQNATAFNQPIGAWNISSVYSLDTMFAGATVFNQDISTWNFSTAYATKNMLTGTSFSQINYDKLLNYWASHPTSRPPIISGSGYHMDALGLVYTSLVAHNQLIQPLQIYGDLLVPSYIQSYVPFTAKTFFALNDSLSGPFGTTAQYQVYYSGSLVSGTSSPAVLFQIVNPGDTYAITIPNISIPYTGRIAGTVAISIVDASDPNKTPILRYNIRVIPPTPCFLEGTTILCNVNNQDVYMPIEEIVNGTLVKTSINGYKKVVAIGNASIQNTNTDERKQERLYKCTPANYPELKEDLYITGCHSILVDSLTEKEREDTIKHVKKIFVTDNKYRLMACVDKRAEPWQSEGTYTIWHFALENENVKMNYGVYANGGLLVETASINYMNNKSNMTLV